MIDNYFRAILPKYTDKILALYKALRLTPNNISIGSVVIAAVAAFLCAKGHNLSAIAMWWLGRLFDGTDGIYARATGQATDFGAYLDIVCDMASYSLMIFGFMTLHPESMTSWAIILFLYVLCITSALSLGTIEERRKIEPRDNRGLRLGAGLAEGGETGMAYTVFLLFPVALPILVKIWITILVLTIVFRTVLARRILAT